MLYYFLSNRPDPLLQCSTIFCPTGLTHFCNISKHWPDPLLQCFTIFLSNRPDPLLQCSTIFLSNRSDPLLQCIYMSAWPSFAMFFYHQLVPVLQCSSQSQFCNVYPTLAWPSFALIDVPQACTSFAVFENIGLSQFCIHWLVLASPTFTGKCTCRMNHFCKGL